MDVHPGLTHYAHASLKRYQMNAHFNFIQNRPPGRLFFLKTIFTN